MGLTAVGPASSLSVIFFEDACAEIATPLCNGRGEAVGAAVGAALAVAAGCTLAAKASSPVGASGGALGAGGLEVSPTGSIPAARVTAG
jgi:hypothetical protein